MGPDSVAFLVVIALVALSLVSYLGRGRIRG